MQDATSTDYFVRPSIYLYVCLYVRIPECVSDVIVSSLEGLSLLGAPVETTRKKTFTSYEPTLQTSKCLVTSSFIIIMREFVFERKRGEDQEIINKGTCHLLQLVQGHTKNVYYDIKGWLKNNNNYNNLSVFCRRIVF